MIVVAAASAHSHRQQTVEVPIFSAAHAPLSLSHSHGVQSDTGELCLALPSPILLFAGVFALMDVVPSRAYLVTLSGCTSSAPYRCMMYPAHPRSAWRSRPGVALSTVPAGRLWRVARSLLAPVQPTRAIRNRIEEENLAGGRCVLE